METNGTTMEEVRTMEAIQSINHKIPELTIRDLFAIHALNGLLADSTTNGYAEDFAQKAYIFADAMLKAREVKKND